MDNRIHDDRATLVNMMIIKAGLEENGGEESNERREETRKESEVKVRRRKTVAIRAWRGR